MKKSSAFSDNVCYYLIADVGVWLSLVERFVRDEEVACSNPVTPTIEKPWKQGFFFVLRKECPSMVTYW